MEQNDIAIEEVKQMGADDAAIVLSPEPEAVVEKP
jgi:hypothetical protein